VTTGVAHPELPEVICEIRRRNHPECTGWDPELDDYRDWPNPDHEPPKSVQGDVKGKLAEMAGRAEAAPVTGELEGFAAGLEGSGRAASRWDDEQVALVDAAIKAVCEDHRGGGEFTTDAVWEKLDGAVPVTKGLTGRLKVAQHAGLMDSTGKTAISQRGGHHDHGQRLTVWYSLIPK
jgi:hypothetical protein